RGAGGTVNNSGTIRASGPNGGSGGRVLIEAAYARVDGMIRAQGGDVRITGTEAVELGGTVDVSSATGIGGDVVVESSGGIEVGGGAVVDASGFSGGGTVQIGGGFQGRNVAISNAADLAVEAGAAIRANATDSGDGGVLIFWADQDTLFSGEAQARALGSTGNGGFVEISGKENLFYDGMVDTTAAYGFAGTVLFDPTNVTISAAVDSVSNINNVALSNLLDLGNNVIITSNFGAAGPAGNITINDRVEWYQEDALTEGGTLTLLAVGDITFNRSVRSAGAGGINVVAGWDGHTGLEDPLSGSALTMPGGFNMEAVLATMNDGDAGNDAAGVGGGSVFVGRAANTQFVEVGSRFGDTNIAGQDLFVTAGTGGNDRWGMVGFHDSGYEYELGRTYHSTKNEWWGNAAGNVQGKDYITMLGGTLYAGGDFKGAGHGAQGDITVGLGGRLDMRGADNRTNGYVQMGHGGSANSEPQRTTASPTRTTRDGFLFDVADNNRTFFGSSWWTNELGDAARVDSNISVTADGDILVMAARQFDQTPGYEDLTYHDQSTGAYAQIGHGGYRNVGSYHGSVSVTAHGETGVDDKRGLAGAGVQLRGGNGSGRFAVIGHGSSGVGNRRTIFDQSASGAITVHASTGAVRMLGFNQLPRTGDRNTGEMLDTDTPLPLNSTTDAGHAYSHVQIGHGGSYGSAPTTGGQYIPPGGSNINNVIPDTSFSGDVTVFAGGTVKVRDNMGYDADGVWHADPGPGVDPVLLEGGIQRDIGIEIRAGNMQYGYGQIGHGGSNLRAITDGTSTGYSGNIEVTADQGGMLVVGGEEKRADSDTYGLNQVQIGHGGYSVLGEKSGHVTVVSGGDLIFRTGRMRIGYAQVGHGGHSSSTDAIAGDGLSSIAVRAGGNVEFTSRISAPSDVLLSPDYVDRYIGELGGSVSATAEWTERVANPGTVTEVPQVGTTATGTTVRPFAWDTGQKFAMVGHGGNNVSFTGDFSVNNTIEVEAGNNIRFTAGDDDRDFVQIGIGGYRSGGNPDIRGGDILVTAGQDIIFDASNPGSSRMLRTTMHGVAIYDEFGNLVTAGQQILQGRGFAAYAQIGNGGYDFDADIDGSITVEAGGDLHMIGPESSEVLSVTGFESYYLEGPSGAALHASNPNGIDNPWIGKAHALTTLQEATMMQRSFQLYHGGGGTADQGNVGDIVPETLVIAISGTGNHSLYDFDNGDGTGTLMRGATRAAAETDSRGSYGTIDYATGLVTVDVSTTNATPGTLGDLLETSGSPTRTVAYSYVHPVSGTVAISGERTPEMLTAIRPNEVSLDHGWIMAGTLKIVIGNDPDNPVDVIVANPTGGTELLNAAGDVVGRIDYASGRIRFIENVNPGGEAVVANYDYTTGRKERAYVQLGHGGYSSNVGGINSPGHSGEIKVSAGGDVRFHAGNHNQSYAQLGHGGNASAGQHGAVGDLSVDRSGDITVEAGGIVEFLSGTGIDFHRTVQYSQLGHGGYSAGGTHRGHISVTAGVGERSVANGQIGGGETAGVVFTAGGGIDTYTMLGHGGRSSNAGTTEGGAYSGDITVTSGAGIHFTSGTTWENTAFGSTGQNGRNFSMLGHGGYDGDVNNNTYVPGIGHNGAIFVKALTGDIVFSAGSLDNGSLGEGYGRLHFSQLGHGGYASNGDHWGDITVAADDGNIVFTAGRATDNDNEKYNFAMIGHGGAALAGSIGRPDDEIRVTAQGDPLEGNGNIVFSAGDRSSAVQIGNGGRSVGGSHQSDIYVYASGDIAFTGGMSPDQLVQRFGEYQLGVDQHPTLLDLIFLDQAAFGTGETSLMSGNIVPGSVVFKENAVAGTASYLTAVATHHDEDNGDGTGNIVRTADGEVMGTIDYETGRLSIAAQMTAQDTAGSVPDIYVDYDHVNPLANDSYTAYAQIGNGGRSARPRTDSAFNDATFRGDIDVRSGVDAAGDIANGIGSIRFQAGNDQRTYVQIGHGGDGALGRDIGFTGEIKVVSGGGIHFRGGKGLEDNHSMSFDNQAAGDLVPDSLGIGHGTSNAGMSSIVYASAMIGHGGVDAHVLNAGNIQNVDVFGTEGHNGAIDVFARDGDIEFTAGDTRGFGHFVQIGHGGYQSQGDHNGKIDVVAEKGDIVFTGGGAAFHGTTSADKRSFAKIGHGGGNTRGNLEGDIFVEATQGSVVFAGGDSANAATAVPYAAIVYTGNTAATQTHANADRVDSRQNFAMIGHGGVFQYGDKTGDIDVIAGNGISFSGGLRLDGGRDNNTVNMAFARIGHGGYFSMRHYRTDYGLTQATAADTYNLPFWVDGDGNYVLDGTGSFFWPTTDDQDPLIDGVTGAPLYDGFSGNITLTATGGDVDFMAGTGNNTYVQVGHGGYETGGDHSGDIEITADNGHIVFDANRSAETGSAGSGTTSYAQAGHGGFRSSGEHSGSIELRSADQIRFEAGRSESFAMVGHGGRDDHATTTVSSGGVTYRYSSNRGFRPASMTGDITVNAVGDIYFSGGVSNGDNSLSGDRAFTQIGHGGYRAHANPDPDSQHGDGHSGNITVVSEAGSLTMRGGDRTNAHALIGHGGTEVFGNHGGDGTGNRAQSNIHVEAQTGIDMMAAGRASSNTQARNFAQVGHGGWRSSFRDIQDIDANLYGLMKPYGGSFGADNAGLNPLTPFTTDPEGGRFGLLAQLGTFQGDITVITNGAGADIRFIGPSEDEGTLGRRAEDSYVQLGHGGWRTFGDIEGDIVVESGGGIQFVALQGTTDLANSNHNAAYAMLGHGGYESGGSYTGDISVTARDTILFKGADSLNGANRGFVQLGHGGNDSSKSSGQYREATRDSGVAATIPPTSFQIGNSGDITVTVTDGDLEFLAGRDHQNYAQLGHGGYLTRDTHSGDITVDVGGGIRFVASVDSDGSGNENPGTNDRAYVQLGHGGTGSSSTNSAFGSHNGDITVSAGRFGSGHEEEGRGIVFRSGDDERNYSQLGHGGYEVFGYGLGADAVGFSGDINVSADGSILFVAGTIGGRDIWNNTTGIIYTQLGHGGYNADVAQDRAALYGLTDGDGNPVGHSGNIAVVSGGSIEFLGGDATRLYEPSPGDNYGRIHYAQLGHGGYSAAGNHWGDIEVRAGIERNLTVLDPDARIYFAAGSATSNQFDDHSNYVQLGHGGRAALGDHGLRDGDNNALDTISVMSGGDITFTAEAGGVNSYAMLGNGGYGTRGDHAANIQVFAEGSILFTGGMVPPNPELGGGVDNQYSWAGASNGTGSTNTNTRIYGLEWAANLHDGGLVNSTPVDGTPGRVNIRMSRVVPGSISITIRDSAEIIGVLIDDGDNGLITDREITADFGNGVETIAAGTRVADIGYTVSGVTTAGYHPTGRTHITFLRDMNPGANTGTANLALEIEHGAGDRAFAQLGNGGYDADQPNSSTGIGNTGDIRVTARTGDIGFEGGAQNAAYGQLGHGGHSNRGAHAGDIVVRAGAGVRMESGSGLQTYTQIGHGGYDADGSQAGAITVSAGSGQLFTSLGTGIFDDGGDFDRDGNPDAITFATSDAVLGTIDVLGGQGTLESAYSQIGHGGRSASGAGADTHQGHIGVSATGDIVLLGGTASRNYAQIGHGGWDSGSSVDITGDISVISTGGDLTLKADAFNSYALIGHGDDDDSNVNNLAGSREGGIFVLADRITLDRNGNRVAWIGHQFKMAVNQNNPFSNVNNVLANPADNLGGGYQVIGRKGMILGNNGSVIDNNNFTINDSIRDRLITPNIGSGPVTITGGNITVSSLLDGTTVWEDEASRANGLNLIAGGDIDINSTIQNPGTGAVNLIAGASLAMSSIVDRPSIGAADYQQIDHRFSAPTGYLDIFRVVSDGAQFGNGHLGLDGLPVAIASVDFFSFNGEVSIHSSPGTSTPFAVGSRDGLTSVIGYGVYVNGGNNTDEYAQIGFRSVNATNDDGEVDEFTGNAIGDIIVHAKEGGIHVEAGSQTRAIAMIGHGGDDSTGGSSVVTADPSHSGAISVNATFGATAGDISLIAGVDIADPFDRDQQWVMIGHGGRAIAGNHSGDIEVLGGNIVIQGGGQNTGTDDSFAQVGHGGTSSPGNLDGDITVNASGTLSLTAGGGDNAFAHIGHGGFNSDGLKSGNISVSSGGATTLAGGTTVDDSADAPAAVTAAGVNRFAQIGHGGLNSDGNTAGNISVISGASLMAQAGNRNSDYVQIGHGGRAARGGHGVAGNVITVDTAGAITFAGGASGQPDGGFSGRFAYAMLGHGGHDADNPNPSHYSDNAGGLPGEPTPAERVGNTADITVSSQTGDITFTSGSQDESFAQLGHGGVYTDGDHTGAITVTATSGSVVFDASLHPGMDPSSTTSSDNPNERYVMLGHGGHFASGDQTGHISVTAGGTGTVTFTGGSDANSFAQLGHGGRNDYRMSSTGNNYNDKFYPGTHYGNIILNTGGDIAFSGGAGSVAYAQLGHGGFRSAAKAGEGHEGTITALSGGRVDFAGGTAGNTYAQLGHGGGEALGNHGNFDANGDSAIENAITVVGADGVRFAASASGNSNNSYAQLGHGGRSASFNSSIVVSAEPGPASGYHLNTPIADPLGSAGSITVRAGRDLAGTLLNNNAEIVFTGGADDDGYSQLGHGGLATSGDHNGDIDVLATGSISFTASHTEDDAYVQLGHGGIGAIGNLSGSIDVVAGDGVDAGGPGGGLVLRAGDQADNYAQIGHGGTGATGSHVGDISIGAEGDIDIAGAAGTLAYAQIGNGGNNADGAASGKITVKTANGSLAMSAGSGSQASAQIGHGGTNNATVPKANQEGAIEVDVAGDLVLHSGDGANSYVQIGHGGVNANMHLLGDICVHAGGLITLDGAIGGGAQSYAQIGHGGHNADGNHAGNVTVVSGTAGSGGISLLGGSTAAYQYAQIGHGGNLVGGNLSGNVYAIADNGGDIVLTGGNDFSSNYAMIGHGDGEGNTSTGTRQGGIHIFAGGDLTGTNGAGLENVNVWHQTSGGLTDANYLGGDGFQIFPNLDGLPASAIDADELAVMASKNFGTGDVNIITSLDLDIVFGDPDFPDTYVDSPDDFYFVTGGSVTFLNSYQNAGSGNVTIVAGWNGEAVFPPASVEYEEISPGIFNYCKPTIRDGGAVIDFTNADTFGGDPGGDGIRGTITLGSADQDAPVMVGSRRGTNVAAGYGMTLYGGDTSGAFTQFGFHSDGSGGTTNGDINLYLKGGGLTLESGAAGAFTQIGHGGAGSVGGGAINGAVRISFSDGEPGDIHLLGGSGSGAYAQIGHGGAGLAGSAWSGNVSILGVDGVFLSGGGALDTYAQIGHGGRVASGDLSGSILLDASGDLTLSGGGGTRSYALIGMGGNEHDGNRDGGVALDVGGSVGLGGGQGANSYAQIGHGSGNGSGGSAGDIAVTAVGSVTGAAGTGSGSQVQIGHGGANAGGTSPTGHSGEIDVTAQTGDVVFLGGTSAANNYAQVGHGGYLTGGDHSGGITVLAKEGSIQFSWAANSTAPSNRSYVQLGHGGLDAIGSFTGDIQALAGQDILFRSTNNTTTTRASNYVQLGHGGINAAGDHSGNITVLADQGTLLFQAGSRGGGDRYAQLGHGGIDAAGNHTGNIAVLSHGNATFNTLSGATSITTALRSYVQLGHGGHNADSLAGHSGNIGLASRTGSLTFHASGNDSQGSYAQLGHGGYDAGGAHRGDLVVRTGNNLLFDGGIGSVGGAGVGNYAQLGHGGMRADGSTDAAADLSGSIVVSSHFAGPFADIGDFYDAGGNFGADGTADSIELVAGTSSTGMRFRGGTNSDATGNYAQLGHGGLNNAGNHGGFASRISVRNGTTLNFTGGAGSDAYAQLGHGGRNALGNHSGGLFALANNNITFTRGVNGVRSYAQLGHGGHGAAASGGHSGTIGVASTAGRIAFLGQGTAANTAVESYTQLGHGGFAATGSHHGDIVARAGNNVLFESARAAGSGSYAQMGHGGMLAEGNHSGNLTLSSRLDGTFDDIGDFDGDGIFDSLTFASGTSNEGILFVGGNLASASDDSYAQLGHGGRLARGSHSGDIHLDSLAQIRFVAGQTGLRNYAQLGHGGSDAAVIGGGFGTAGNSGDITAISRAGVAEFRWTSTSAVTSDGTYVQLGHGGHVTDPAISGVASGGDHSGDIFLSSNGNLMFRSTTGGITADGTTSKGNYVQLGHGGLRWNGDHEGDITAVSETGTVVFTAGNNQNSHPDLALPSEGGPDRYAQLGHGGGFAQGSHSGDIQVLAEGNLQFLAGRNPRSYAQLGHGGHAASGGAAGDIRVGSRTGSIDVRYTNDGTSTSATTDTPGFGSYAQIGHGGFDYVGNSVGDIVARAGANLLLRAPRGNFPAGNLGSYAQIGHGGFSSEGDQSGNVTVSAGIGGLFSDVTDLDGDGSLDAVDFVAGGDGTLRVFSGAGGTDRYAQIGHGGSSSSGDFGAVDANGDALDTISVTARGDLTVQSRGGTRGYAQIGSGGSNASGANPRGAAAKIHVESAEGSVIALGNTGATAYAQIGNGGRDNLGDHRGDITVVAGQQVAFTASQSNTSTGSTGYVQLGHGGLGAAGDHRGDIVVRAGLGGVEGAVTFTAGKGTDRYAQLGHGGRSAQGGHGGDITVESWGGVSFLGGDFRNATNVNSAELAAAAIAGSGSGQMRLSSSAFGAQVQRGSVMITFSDPAAPEYAEITDDLAGNLVDMNGNVVGTINYGNAAATFTVPVANTGSTAASTFNDANFSRAYAQLGHGGSNASGDGNSGDIGVDAGLGGVEGDVLFRGGVGAEGFVHLGHGGRQTGGDHSGSIAVNALGDISVLGGGSNSTRQYAYSQIGHGSWNATGNHSGSIDAHAGGLLEVVAGGGQDAVAVIGHGGRSAAGNLDGSISASGAGGVRVIGGQTVDDGTGTELGGVESYAQIGHHGVRATTDFSTFTGAVTVDSGAGIELSGGSRQNSYAMIGHGGRNAQGVRGGDVTVSAVDAILANGGTGLRSWTMIGHASNVNNGHLAGDMSGAVSVISQNGAIGFMAGSGSDSFAHIGHGGRQSAGSHSGDVSVVARGDITFAGGSTSGAYAGAGHLGISLSGDIEGAVTVVSEEGDVSLTGGSAADTFAQIGHGGTSASGTVGNADVSVNAAGSVSLAAGSATFVHAIIGHGGNNALNLQVSDSDIVLNSAPGSGNGDVVLQGGGSNGGALIGHGGNRSDGNAGVGDNSASGNVLVANAANVILQAGGATDAFAQIGHGGERAVGTHSGNVTINATGEIAVLGGSGGANALARIGHGGALNGGANNGPKTGNIELNANGDIVVAGGSSALASAHVGHGGHGASSDFSGTILVNSGGSVEVVGGSGSDSYAQIGHGGTLSGGEVTNAAITVNAANAIDVLASATQSVYAQIGHGGFNSYDFTVANSDIAVNTAAGSGTGDVAVRGGAVNSSAMIGHGGART
ncbi:MAG: hypothetical protein WD342_15515, partial [Verrucomicrobiales bacterium]